MKPKYMVIDCYENELGDFIGYANTYSECKDITRERIEETDGECSVYALPLNKETGNYTWKKAIKVRV